jgi:hypothetical protein
MNRIFALLIAVVVSASVAGAGDVRIKAVTTTGPEEEPTTTFAGDTPKIFALFKTKGVQDGDKLRGVWIADDVGDAAPKGSKIDEETITADGDTDDGAFSLSKPTNGWPAGKYHVEIYANDELATKVKFTIEAAGKTGKESEESAEVPEERKLKSMTNSSLLSFGRAVKKQNFSGFYQDIVCVAETHDSTKVTGSIQGFFRQGNRPPVSD